MNQFIKYCLGCGAAIMLLSQASPAYCEHCEPHDVPHTHQEAPNSLSSGLSVSYVSATGPAPLVSSSLAGLLLEDQLRADDNS